MRAAPVLHALSGGATRGKVQAVVIGLVALVSTAAVTLALGPRADASAPLERAFAAQHAVALADLIMAVFEGALVLSRTARSSEPFWNTIKTLITTVGFLVAEPQP